MSLDDQIPETGNKLGDELLAIHRSYLSTLFPLIQKKLIKGLAHITGGGFEGNVSRILPENVDATVDTTFWFPPGIFKAIQRLADVETEEMYRVFNMGIGYLAVVDPVGIDAVVQAFQGHGHRAHLIGRVVEGPTEVSLVK